MHMRGCLKGKPPLSVFMIFATLPPPLISWSQRGQGGGDCLRRVLLRGLRVKKHCVSREAADIQVTARWCWCEPERLLIGLGFWFALVTHWWLQLCHRSQVFNVMGHTNFSDVSSSISCHALTARFFNPDDIPLLNPLSSYFLFGQRVGFYAPHPDMVPVQCIGWHGGRWNVILWGDVVPVDHLRHRTVLPGCDGLDSFVVPLSDPISARHIGTPRPKTYTPAICKLSELLTGKRGAIVS